MTISIVLADDHPVVRRGVRSLFDHHQDFSVVGEACDGLEAVQLVESLEPNVLILDLMIPGLSGLDVLKTVCKRSAHTRVVVLSMHSSSAFIVEALKTGASGYVLKGGPEEELIRAVQEAAAGKRFLSPVVSQIAIDGYTEQARASSFDSHEILSRREREVLQLAAEGRTSQEIAKRLHISRRTVENHRSHVMQKLSLHNQSELVRYALRHGLISAEQ